MAKQQPLSTLSGELFPWERAAGFKSLAELDAARTDYTRINDQLLTGGSYWIAGDFDLIAGEGVDLVVDSAWGTFANDWGAVGADYLPVVVSDDGEQKPEWWFRRTLQGAIPVLRSGGTVFTHCGAGINRGPSLAYLLLRTHWGLKPAAAKRLIRRVRPQAWIAYADQVDEYLRTHDWRALVA